MTLKIKSRGANDGSSSRPSDRPVPRPVCARRSGAAGLCVAATIAILAFAAAPALAGIGVERAVLSASNQDRTQDLQAGSHPYALTTTFVLTEAVSAFNVKDVDLELPPGFVGDPNATPRCTYHTFIGSIHDGGTACSNDDAIGFATSYFSQNAQNPSEITTDTSNPVYNLLPPPGVAAEFGYIVGGRTPVLLQSTVRTGADYGLTTKASNVNQSEHVRASKVTLWGDPEEPVHNDVRGGCVRQFGQTIETESDGLAPSEEEFESVASPRFIEGHHVEEVGQLFSNGECPSSAPELPLLTNPTSCDAPRTATISVDAWQEQGVFASRAISMPEITGCEKLPFSPSLEVKPDGEAGSTPTGLNVDLRVPQEATSNPAGLAEADVKDTSVTLPAGMQLSPSAADGLQACSNAQIGYTGESIELNPSSEPGVRTPQFTPAAPSCPDASKIATVKIKTPLLEGELEGSVYLAAPQNFAGVPENPFSSLVAMYLVAEEPKTGVLIKLPGRVALNEATGQVTTTFENTPQLPYSELQFDLYGTARAPLATPALCGSYTTQASLTPWTSDTPVAVSSNPETFKVTSGPSGSACTYAGQPLPFSPSLTSGTTNINAGGFSPLSTVIHREDGQQAIHNVTISYPPGVSAVLTGVPQCGEAQANAGTCGAESLIGEDTASVGLGQDPYTVTGGKVYLTGPYEGAPFGLSIVTPTKAGPFVLQEGRPVVTRARIEINPTTAAVTVTTGEVPQILDGIPLNVKQIYVNINRPNFAINPTSCEHMGVSGSVGGWEGTSFPVADPFQVADCGSLKFTPKFSASTAAHTSKLLGASLVTKIEEPAGALGTQADIARVKVQLPKQLPSQLKTLQKACLAKTFEASPEACLRESPHSKVGEAEVHTPLLPVPLTGNAYLVSHGGEAFPSLTLVLKGDGVTIVLVGATDITKGITTTTFKTTPDVPFTSFQLTLPQGEYAALGAYVPNSPTGSLCGTSLVMPTEIVAQNGMALYQQTPIAVTGCPPSVSVTRATVKGNSLAVTLKLGQAGTVVISGKGIRKKTIHGAKAGTRTITIPLTATGRAARKHKAKLKITVALSAAGKTGTTSSTLRA